MSLEPYVCAISGTSVVGTEDDEDHEGIPVGWAAVTIGVRTENPDWIAIQRGKSVVVEQQLLQVPEADREKSRPLAILLARASFAALENGTPRYLVDEQQLTVSAEQLPGLLEFLGQTDE